MFFFKDIIIFFGVVVGYYCVRCIEGNFVDFIVVLVVNSWFSEDDFIVYDGKGFIFVWYVLFVLVMFDGLLLFSSCEQVLVGNVIEGLLFDGVMVVLFGGEVDVLKLWQWVVIKQICDFLIVQLIEVGGEIFDVIEWFQQRFFIVMVCMCVNGEMS